MYKTASRKIDKKWNSATTKHRAPKMPKGAGGIGVDVEYKRTKYGVKRVVLDT